MLDTEWDTPDGSVRVSDCMPPRGEAADVVRVARGVSGAVPMRTRLRLRFDYGHVEPWVRRVGHQVAGIAGPDAVWLRTPIELSEIERTQTAEFVVRAGETVPFVLTLRRRTTRGRDRSTPTVRSMTPRRSGRTGWRGAPIAADTPTPFGARC